MDIGEEPHNAGSDLMREMLAEQELEATKFTEDFLTQTPNSQIEFILCSGGEVH